MIVPVILSGGSGTRLWPLSTEAHPKQFLPLFGERSLFQETVLRVTADGFLAPLVIGSREHRFLMAYQLAEIGVEARTIVLEPDGRNTAPAIAVAATVLPPAERDALLLVLPSDHVIGRPDAFLAAVASARGAAERGALVTFGIEPDRPHTGYGYIRSGQPHADAAGCFHVERFVEKPDLDTARGFLEAGGYCWNGGIFLFRAETVLDELALHRPDMVAACRAAVEASVRDQDFLRLDETAFAACPAGSIDVEVMERTSRAAVVPAPDLEWSDVGSWQAVWEIGRKDRERNVSLGPIVALDVSGSYLSSDSRRLAAIGIRDTVVVVTEDAVLVVPRDRAEEVKAVAERLSDEDAAAPAATVHRPWGNFRTLTRGDGFQVKRIVLRPGGKLSLQYHHHRAEHWVVVAGRARVHRNDEQFELGPGQSTHIPQGARHRLENVGEDDLSVIEVQCGAYLGEDDIVRLEDVYGRA